MKTKYYIIDGLNYRFSRLLDVRHHFLMYNENDRREMSGSLITGYNSIGEITTDYIFVYKNGKLKLIRQK